MPRQKQPLFEYLAFVHAKAALVLWGVVYVLWAPENIREEVGQSLIYISGLFAIIGGIVGLIGLTITFYGSLERIYQGRIVEASGLTLALAGVLTYFLTSAYFTVKFNDPHLHPRTAIAYALCAATLSRIVVVRKGFSRWEV